MGTKKVDRKIVRLRQDLQDSVKGDYRHFMLKEIYEQPEVMKKPWRARSVKPM